MSEKKARLVIQSYPVFVLGNEWLEQLFCPVCGVSSWHHLVRHSDGQLSVSWASRELWQQVAHVDPVHANPTVSEFSRRQARRLSTRRSDGGRLFDPM